VISQALLSSLAWGWMAVAAATAVVLLKISAPYGRHARKGWGPSLPAWAGWVLMELPSPALIAAGFLTSPYRSDPATALLAAAWLGHYGYRICIFPFLGAGKKAPMPLSIAATAVLFNAGNGSFNGYGLFHLDGPREVGPRLLAGLALFCVGFFIHFKSDAILRALRKPGETGYQIPRGFLYRWSSCPNYLGEIVEWVGFAIAAGTLWPASFAVWSIANLAPRALAHHRWYQQKFPDYPKERRALI
jgi:3-oxo-5-alpha-steroid 4-dehydrogenase 1